MTNAFANHVATQMVCMDTTADKLAEVLGFKRSTIVNMWVRGDYIPDPTYLPKLAKVLDVDLVTLALNWLGAVLPDHQEAFQAGVITRADQIAMNEAAQ
ncbi:MAG: helix-turn-helix transcriptional regulator [Caulobacter sp.]